MHPLEHAALPGRTDPIAYALLTGVENEVRPRSHEIRSGARRGITAWNGRLRQWRHCQWGRHNILAAEYSLFIVSDPIASLFIVSGSKPGPYRRLGRRLLYRFAAWFPGGAAVSLPCDGSFPAPRRTGLGVLHHPAPGSSLSQRNRGKVLGPIDSARTASAAAPELSAYRPKGRLRSICVKRLSAVVTGRVLSV